MADLKQRVRAFAKTVLSIFLMLNPKLWLFEDFSQSKIPVKL